MCLLDFYLSFVWVVQHTLLSCGASDTCGHEQIWSAHANRQCSVFEAELQDVIPICHATIAGTRIIGRLTAGYVYTQPVSQKSTRGFEEDADTLG